MCRSIPSLLLSASCLLSLLAACRDGPSPTAPKDATARPPSSSLTDAASPGGNPFFHWLAPIREPGTFTGTFDATLAPRLNVEVCVLAGADDCAGPPMRSFTSSGRDPYETIRISAAREYYQVYFGTQDDDVDPATNYRVRVLADGDQLLGYADVDVVPTRADLAGVDADQFVGVVKGDWLPVRFRLEEGVLAFNAPPTVAITAPADGTTVPEGTSLTFTGTASDAEDGDLSASIAWSSDVDGALGTGASISTTLAVGAHVVTASVADGKGATSTAQVHVTVTAEPTPPPTGDCSGPLVNGANHLCSISVPAELDEFSFTAAEGDFITLTASEASDDADLWPWIRLLSPTGELLRNSLGSASAEVFNITAPASGRYRVVVGSRSSGGNITGTGDYRVRLALAPGDFVVPTGDEGGPLTNGDNHTGTIQLGDLDQWSFTADEGDLVSLAVGEVGADDDFWPSIRLVGPDGTLLGTSLGSSAAEVVNVTVPATGSYRVIVSSRSSGGNITGEGDYRLTLARAPGAFVVPSEDEGGALTNGANHTGTIHLADLDQWSLTASAGDLISLRLGELSPDDDFWPWIRIVSPTGQLLHSGLGADVAEVLDLTAPVSGEYRVIVGSRSSGGNITGEGDYRLTLAHVPGAFVVPPDDDGGELTNGANHTGTIGLGDLDQWSVTANAGDLLTLSVAETGTDGDFWPWIQIVSPTGGLLGNNLGSSAAQILNLAAPVSGSYRVIVGSRSSGGNITGAGDYRLTLVRVPGSFVVPPGDEGGALGDGTVHTGTIQLGDLDQWSFAGTAGERVSLNISEVGDDPDYWPWIELVSPTGQVVRSALGPTAAEIRSVTLPATGSYRVIVGSRSSGGAITGAGGYRLTLLRGF